MLRRMLGVLLMVAVVSALAPAVAVAASPALAAQSLHGCAVPEAAPSCTSICQRAPTGIEHAQTSSAGGHAATGPSCAVFERVSIDTGAKRDWSLPPDRSAYLRFQRFLL